ncbi:histidine phosphatase superfamily [Delphinella strobiligena]|nr:histidine phosphatase superfamily [Delphinella strobiligena]
MLSKSLATISLLSSAVTAETVLGVYMFHRHGDRTSKSTPPTNLTDLGYQEVFTSGDYYRNRYIASTATSQIHGISPDTVVQAQVAASAPSDTVLQNSAAGFLQGLYPPVGDVLGSQTLRNGTNVTSPLNGFQLIPISIVTAGTGSESSGWLEAATGCGAATSSSNNYFYSDEYLSLLNSTYDFYQSVVPVVNQTFNSSFTTFKHAYLVYDLINVAEIHNATIQDNDIITDNDNEAYFQLRTRADAHEWGLGYNASDDVRAIAGMTLAAEIVQFLNTTLTGKDKQKFGVQFGAYGSFGSFFGLANLTSQNPDFYGIADYASSMTFELVTNATVNSSVPVPDNSDISVRFLWHNGTASNSSEPVAYPLFGTSDELMAWTDFTSAMSKISVGTEQQWCTICKNTTGACAAYVDSSSANSSTTTGANSNNSKSGNGLSPAVNGVIGAMVTLAVILGLEALILTVGGMRVVSKKRLAGAAVTPVSHVNEAKI